MFYWIGTFLFLELYSLCFALHGLKKGNKKYWLCLVPFAVFYFLDKELKGFTVLTIRVKSMLFTSILMTVIAVVACLISRWGLATLPERSAAPLQQLMYVPLGFSIFISWICLAKTTSTLLFKNGCSFRADLLVCLLLLPIPFLILFMHPKEKTLCR